MTTLYDVGGSEFNLDDLPTMKNAELVKTYCNLAQFVGEKPVTKFSDHDTAVKRTKALIEKYGTPATASASSVEAVAEEAVVAAAHSNPDITALGQKILDDLAGLVAIISVKDAKAITDLERGILLGIKALKKVTVSDKVRDHISRLAAARRKK